MPVVEDAMRYELEARENGTFERKAAISIGGCLNGRWPGQLVVRHEHDFVAGEWLTDDIDGSAAKHNSAPKDQLDGRIGHWSEALESGPSRKSRLPNSRRELPAEIV